MHCMTVRTTPTRMVELGLGGNVHCCRCFYSHRSEIAAVLLKCVVVDVNGSIFCIFPVSFIFLLQIGEQSVNSKFTTFRFRDFAVYGRCSMPQCQCKAHLLFLFSRLNLCALTINDM